MTTSSDLFWYKWPLAIIWWQPPRRRRRRKSGYSYKHTNSSDVCSYGTHIYDNQSHKYNSNNNVSSNSIEHRDTSAYSNKIDQKNEIDVDRGHGLAPLGAPIPMHKFHCFVVEWWLGRDTFYGTTQMEYSRWPGIMSNISTSNDERKKKKKKKCTWNENTNPRSNAPHNQTHSHFLWFFLPNRRDVCHS